MQHTLMNTYRMKEEHNSHNLNLDAKTLRPGSKQIVSKSENLRAKINWQLMLYNIWTLLHVDKLSGITWTKSKNMLILSDRPSYLSYAN